MKKTIYLALAILLAFDTATAQNYRRWDFTKWSQQTIDNLKIEAAKERPAEGWSDIEAAKNDVAGAVAPDATKEKCFWYASSEFGALKANGQEIVELTGLTFGEGYSKNRSLAIAIDYPSTSIGTYAGPQYLWLGGGNKAAGNRLMCFTIPNVTIGQKMTFVIESHRSGQGRGIGLYVNDVNNDSNRIGNAFTPDAQETYTWENWTLPEGVTDEDGDGMVDILVYNTNGCHIYSIEIGENMEARNVGYLYNGDLNAEAAYNILLEDNNNKVTAIEANKTFTIEDFSSFEALVISSTVSNEDAIASLKGIQPFLPILNLNPALYAIWGYGEAINAGIPYATVCNKSHPLFNGIELIEDTDAETPTFVMELLSDELPFTGLKLSGLFANDPILAHAYQNESITAIHSHNLSHNGYIYIPYTQEAFANATAPIIINNAITLLASSKAPITQAPAPSFTLEYEHLNTFVSLKSNVPSAQIYYTTDGSTPTLESTLYTEPISLTAESTVKAIAIGDGYLQSDVAEKLVDIRQMAPMPAFAMTSEDGKTIVSITSELENGQIYYNYKGSDAKAQSSLYTKPIEFNSGKDIYAFVMADSFLNSKLATAKITVKNPKVRIDILSKMDANKEEYLSHTNPDTQNADGTTGYYFSWGNTNNYPYYDPAGDQIVTGSDGLDSVIHTKLNAEEVVDIENGWSVRSRGHRISWEANNPGMKYGDSGGFNPETVNDEDAYLPVTSYLVHLYDWDKTYPSSAIIQTTNKFAGPFDIVAYIANCQGGTPRPKVVFEVATSNDDNATWTVVGDTCEFDQPRRIYRKYTRSYEGTEEVYVRARIANDGSRAGFYNIYIANEGTESKKIIEEQATGITSVGNEGDAMPEAIFDLRGIRQSVLKQGLNIIRNSDGTTRKVIIK